MKRSLSIFSIVFCFTVKSLWASPPVPRGGLYTDFEVINGDTTWISNVKLQPIRIFASKSDRRRYDKLVRNVVKVYPIARQAEKRFSEMEQALTGITQKKKQREYIRKLEKELVKEYTPILRKMTFSQGKILIKLIDRQIDKTSYEIVRELRGKFTASLWQGVAYLFDANLKQEYDPHGDDEMIEEIITLFEAGKL